MLNLAEGRYFIKALSRYNLFLHLRNLKRYITILFMKMEIPSEKDPRQEEKQTPFPPQSHKTSIFIKQLIFSNDSRAW